MPRSLTEDVHFRMLRALEERPNLSQREISRDLGVSLGAVNYCLRALIETRQIKVQNFKSSDHKLRYAYVLTPRGLTKKAQLAGAFLKRKILEFEALEAEIEAVKADMEPYGGERPLS